MMPTETNTLNRAISLLQQGLAGKAHFERLPLVDPKGAPLRLATKSGFCLDFRFEPWKGKGAVSRSAKRVRTIGRLPTVWVLRRGSSRLRQELRESGASFVDLSGAVHLELPGLIVDRSDLKPAPRLRSSKSAIDPFADRSSRVCRVLLSGPATRIWGVRQLAEAAEVNPSTASRVVHELAREGLVEFERHGRSSSTRVLEPHALLRGWTQAYDWGRNERLAFNAPIGDAEKFLPRMKRVLTTTGWALSLHAGASLIAPHSMWERVHLYFAGTEAQLLEVTRNAGWRIAEEGNLVIMFPFYKESVWWRVQKRRGLPVVSVLQLALDLWHYPLRGREQAEHLVQSKLEPQWSGDEKTRVPGASVHGLLGELKNGLALIYGTRLKGVYGYGSYARGDQGAESDLDVIVVLDRVERYAAEVDRTGELISKLSLSYGVSVSRVFVPESEWLSGESAFLTNAREEAVPA